METVGSAHPGGLSRGTGPRRLETCKLYYPLEKNMRGLLIAFAGLLLIAACSSDPPEFEIVGRSASDGTDLFGDYTVRVECDIRNGGGSGRVTVTAFVDATIGAWTKRQSSVMREGESRTFTFDFPEIEDQSVGDNSYEYVCGLE